MSMFRYILTPRGAADEGDGDGIPSAKGDKLKQSDRKVQGEMSFYSARRGVSIVKKSNQGLALRETQTQIQNIYLTSYMTQT